MAGGNIKRINAKKKYAGFKFSSILGKSIYAKDYIAKSNTLQACMILMVSQTN
jgi:hypothetical protein